MRFVELFLLLAIASQSFGQVSVQVTIVKQKAMLRMFNKNAVKDFSMWTVAMTNQGTEPSGVQEASVLIHLPQINPYPAATMLPIVTAEQKGSGWARAGRAATFVGQVGAFAISGKIVANSSIWGAVATGVVGFVPTVVQTINGEARPSLANFNSLTWLDTLMLSASQTATRNIFSSPQLDNSPAINFVLTPSTVQVRMAK